MILRNQDSWAWRGSRVQTAARAHGADARQESRRPAALGRFALGAGLTLVVAGCDAGATLGSVSLGDDTPPAYDYANDGPVVAKVLVEAPEASDFILQATLPLPPGTYVQGETLVPLAVLTSSDTTAVPTQVEIVTNYPDPAQGAAVVEVIAHVRRPDVPVGTPIEYEVVFHPHAAAPFELSHSVESLLSAPNSLLLRAKDVFGHMYQFDLLTDHRSGEGERVRDGAVVREHKTSGSLTPVTPVTGPQATLPHLMGVHAYVRTFDGEDFFALDLHLHNGFDGRDASTSSDDVLDELHFERLGLRLPGGWRIIDSAPNPHTGTQVLSQVMQDYDIVTPMGDGKLHMMLRQGQFWRRLMIARDAQAEARARLHLERRNMGFCQPGQSVNGGELWSWWNEQTARYLPQAHRLPELDEISTRENLRAQYAVALDNRLNQVRNGTTSSYPVASGNLGWAHPWGVGHGGMAGGDEITPTVGVDIAWAASQAGYRHTELKARMNVDRQPLALYGADGESYAFHKVVQTSGQYSPWLDQSFSMHPVGGDAIGFSTAPMHQTAAANATGRVAPYREALIAYQPHDLEHYIRYLNNLLVLAWLGNDSLAKEQIEHSGELFRLTHCEAYIGTYGYKPFGGMLLRQDHVAAHPGQGVSYGRPEGWGLYAAAAAYALGDDDLRARFRPWLRNVVQIVAAGQSTCTGNITALHINSPLMGAYMTRQSFELAFVINALESVRRTVFEGSDVAIQHLLEQVVTNATYSTVQAPFWDDSVNAQRRVMGVGRSDMSIPDFCQAIPTEAYYGLDRWETQSAMSPWAYTYAFTRDPVFLQRASQYLQGSGNLLHELQASWGAHLSHSAPLLAVVQKLSSL
jgi:hypothetical protein